MWCGNNGDRCCGYWDVSGCNSGARGNGVGSCGGVDDIDGGVHDSDGG